ncbi:FAD-dependent monooxygenase [Actinocrispum wychmicini]|uniref:2-polyprenyl-6-methoxyphenol hydroxylase-like FAD-dependent oxidoreductase n=1 Tax=Actinocrispum wychmicini TaxID=1213861 RepID=A0A4R2JYF4_9PSEU|nr:FAD-dependent monooxygenase [Actinocrispum wychmicini]TCO62289.1 2-polyprenyl-6-methoxyphenol hydroxylase-like FAD-dependent oxidoreductase [Actinocrispum wychmicini]
MLRDPQVLIVGAGPVGVALACELLQQGISLRIVDKVERLDDTDPHSRGILIWPRSLEVLRRIQVSDRLVARGHRTAGVNYYSGGRLLGPARLDRIPDTPYPFLLTLPQRETEKVLRERFTELGGHVERGVAMEELSGDPDAPVVALRHSDGRREVVTPGWVIGADGPASVVRDQLGIRFDGDPIDVTYAIGDAPVTGRLARNAQYYYSRHGVIALVPLRDGHYRIAANVPHRTEADGPPSREYLQSLLAKRACREVTVGEPDWTRSFRPRLGMAENFRKGRCFLAGDAAHVVSPAGGQGLNVGFLDAASLGWRLAGVIRGELPERVLDEYDHERRSAAARMSRTSAAQARFGLQRRRTRIAVRDMLFVVGRMTGLVQRVLVPLLSQTDVTYGEQITEPFIWRHPSPVRPGQRLPMFASLDLATYTVLLWPGRRPSADWALVQAELARQFPDHVGIRDLASVPGPTQAILCRALGRRPAVAVARPDGHLSLLVPVERVDRAVSFIGSATVSSNIAGIRSDTLSRRSDIYHRGSTMENLR